MTLIHSWEPVRRRVYSLFRLPAQMTVSQWADAHRQLPPESAAEPGQWRTSRVEYTREIMDSLTDPDVEQTVVVAGSQVGKTEILLNALGYFMDREPCPMLLLMPREADVRMFSTDRLAPTIRDTPALTGKVSAAKSRDTGNTITYKKFPGGHIAMVGANAPSNLASRPVRVVFSDEDDRQAESAGNEGDPWLLAWTRTTTFANNKGYRCSTPVRTATSRILQAFGETDQRYYHIPCPRCGQLHTLVWERIHWDKNEDGTVNYASVRASCPHCGGSYNNAEKDAAVADRARAKWIPTAPFSGKRGFRISALYSPFPNATFEKIVRMWHAAQGNPNALQHFFNTILGEAFDGEAEVINFADLALRCEKYAAPVPARAMLLTAGIDVQPDRLEISVIGWGTGEESWLIEHAVIYGDPDIAEGERGSPWDALSDALRADYRHELGCDVGIDFACIDTGGANTQSVYNYCKRHRGSRLFAVKGKAGADRPIIELGAQKRTGRKNSLPVRLYIVGTDQAKTAIAGRLRITEPGAGYCHFPEGTGDDHFRQLTAEKLVTEFRKGRKIQHWEKADKVRNEALDCRVYAYAALMLANPNYQKLGLRLKLLSPKKITKTTLTSPAPDTPAETPAQDPAQEIRHHATTKPKRHRRRGGYVNAWRQ